MRHRKIGMAVVGALLVAPLTALSAPLVDIPMNAQINLGYTYNTQSPSGDAIYVPSFSGIDTQTIYADGALEPEGFTRHNLLSDPGGWFYHYIDFNLAGITVPGTGLDLSAICARVEFDVRYYQDPNTNTNQYGDAPVFLRLYTYANDGNTYLGHRDFSIVYATQSPWNDPPYPEWTHIVVYVNKPGSFTEGGTFAITDVSRIRWYGTDWAGHGDDFVDFKNFQIFTDIQPPQIDPVPDPDLVYPNVPYSRQMTAFSCDGTLSWSLVTGPAGLTINSTTGELSGWTPSPGQAGQDFPVTVRASNGGGSSDLSYTIRVKEPPVLDGSNVASPWGTVHGDISGTQSSDDPSMILDDAWGAGATVDWSANVSTLHALAKRPRHRSSITFDEVGNLYWKTIGGTDCYLVSIQPDGTFRWVGSMSGTPVSLGGEDASSPVVGDGGPTGRVYVLSSTGIAAFRKSDGERLWSTALPDANFASSADRLTPVLHGGALYVVGAGTTSKAVIAVNASNGEVIFARNIATTLGGNQGGQMTLVPDALGAGLHGLYFNGDSNGGTGHEMYGVKIDLASYTASLAWSADGGKVARSHVIYVASSNRVCTHTWNDYGASFYTWDLDGGRPAAANSIGQAWHGWEDFGAVDFDGDDVIGGGFSGRIARYMDIKQPGLFVEPTNVAYNTDFESYTLGSITGQDGWADDISGGYSAVQIVDDPTGGGHGKVMLLDPPGTAGGWQGAVRAVAGLDQLVVIEWDQWRDDTSDNFWIADNAAYDGWWAVGWDQTGQLSASGWGGGAAQVVQQWQHVKYVINTATGTVNLDVDGSTATGGTGDTLIEGIDFEVEPTAAGTPAEGGPTYIDNVVIKHGPAPSPLPFAGNGWYQMNPDFFENRGVGGLYKNQSGKSIYVCGTSSNVLNTTIVGFNVTDSTMYTAAPPQDEQPRWFEYDTGVLFDPRGGPVLGPLTAGQKQRIYFFTSDTQLVALTHLPLIPGDFDNDRDVDSDDLTL
ncbi:MAG: putative Ig domain-containing protein, partial [Planctomycetes bacterium]|nr:putative Ig domain-containing protein [Planctomycetota bacterium]